MASRGEARSPWSNPLRTYSSEGQGELDPLYPRYMDLHRAAGMGGYAADFCQDFCMNDSVRCTGPTSIPPPPPHNWNLTSESYEAMTNREIIAEAVSKSRVLRLLEDYRATRRRLNLFNICTILHRAGKLRLCLPSNVIVYLIGELNEPNCRDEDLKARQIGNALSGFSCLKNCDETRQLIKIMEVKVIECREVLNRQDIAQAFKGLEQMEDSEEVKDLVRALNANQQRQRRTECSK